MANTISNSDDVIDSRDVIARIQELRAELEAWHDEQDTTLSFEYALQDAANFPEHADEYAELKALEALAEEAEGYAADWQYGETLIRDSYFEQYARDFAEDIGAISKDQSWPNYCIDWERAASDLRMDYTQVDFDGVAYWIR